MGALVIEQDPVKRLVGCVSFSAVRVLRILAKHLEPGDTTINQNHIAAEADVTRSHVSNTLSLAAAAGILASRSLGAAGTVVGIAPDMLDRLRDAVKNL